MNRAARHLVAVGELDPRDAAAELLAAHEGEPRWLDEFAEYLDRHRAGRSLARTLAVWGLNQSQAARLFGVSRQALNKWLEHGVPTDRAEAIAELAATTDLLVHYLKRDRIPAVVRRPVAALEGKTLLDLLEDGDTAVLLEASRDMFRFDRAQH